MGRFRAPLWVLDSDSIGQLRAWHLLHEGDEPIAAADDRDDELMAARPIVQDFPKISDMAGEVVLLDYDVRPYSPEELILGDQLTPVLDENNEQIQRLIGKPDNGPVFAKHTNNRVQRKWTEHVEHVVRAEPDAHSQLVPCKPLC